MNNPDYHDEVYSTECGIYEPHCGLDNVLLSWGHDEVRFSQLIFWFCHIDSMQYLYNVMKEQSSLPDEALAMIRYHSFYPWVPQFSSWPYWHYLIVTSTGGTERMLIRILRTKRTRWLWRQCALSTPTTYTARAISPASHRRSSPIISPSSQNFSRPKSTGKVETRRSYFLVRNVLVDVYIE